MTLPRTPAMPPPSHPIWDAVHSVLVISADIITHDYSENGDHLDALPGLIDVGAACECHTWNLPETEAAWWIARETRYRIAATTGAHPRDRSDPLTSTVVGTLARHPAEVQARVLNAAAAALAAETGTDTPHRQPDTPD